jgi:hypothetical protein
VHILHDGPSSVGLSLFAEPFYGLSYCKGGTEEAWYGSAYVCWRLSAPFNFLREIQEETHVRRCCFKKILKQCPHWIGAAPEGLLSDDPRLSSRALGVGKVDWSRKSGMYELGDGSLGYWGWIKSTWVVLRTGSRNAVVTGTFWMVPPRLEKSWYCCPGIVCISSIEIG